MNARDERKEDEMCCILHVCAQFELLWQPESGPIPVAMDEKDRMMTLLMRQQDAFAISSSGCDCG